MKRIITILTLAVASSMAAQTAPPIPMNLFATDEQANSREETLYREGTAKLDENQWSDALQRFQQVAELKGRRADGALYWKAYTLNKLGRRQESLNSLAALRTSYPKSQWLKDAGALELEIKQASGQRVSPEAQGDEEMKLYALNSIMDSDPDRAIPVVESMLANPKTSAKLKERALFVLAQSDSSKAQQIVGTIARGQRGPQLQEKAIQYLGIESSKENMRVLGEIYASTQDTNVKRAVIQAYLVGDNQQGVLAAAKGETNPEVKRAAIQTLGAMDAKAELAQLYPGATPEIKKAILDACVAADNSEFLAQVAKNPSEPVEIRRSALQRLGAVGGKNTAATLIQIYKSESNRDMKEAALDGLFVDDDATAMISLARSENDPQMKRKIVEKLAIMDSKEAKDYMLEILNK
jgi:tetratricopeptide (TPR) repeat protein